MHALNIHVSWAITFLPLYLSTLLVMSSGPGAFLQGNKNLAPYLRWGEEDRFDMIFASIVFQRFLDECVDWI